MLQVRLLAFFMVSIKCMILNKCTEHREVYGDHQILCSLKCPSTFYFIATYEDLIGRKWATLHPHVL